MPTSSNSRAIDLYGAIDQVLVLGAEQCSENHREPLADELKELCLWNGFACDSGQRLVDRAADSRERVDERPVEIEQQMH